MILLCWSIENRILIWSMFTIIQITYTADSTGVGGVYCIHFCLSMLSLFLLCFLCCFARALTSEKEREKNARRFCERRALTKCTQRIMIFMFSFIMDMKNENVYITFCEAIKKIEERVRERELEIRGSVYAKASCTHKCKTTTYAHTSQTQRQQQ